MPRAATSAPRSRSTATACSPSCTRSTWKATPGSGELAIFAGPNYVLSVRRDAAKGFLGVRARAEREPHLLSMGSSFVLYALMDAVVDRYFPVVDMLESDLEPSRTASSARAPSATTSSACTSSSARAWCCATP
jgi:Mg2+ and Co2+ transporter CorA